MLYQWRVVYHLMRALAEDQKGDEEDPNTDDTVVIEADQADRTGTPNSTAENE